MALKNQLFKVDEPVPSLRLHSLEYKNGKWTYCYAFETPVLLRNSRRKTPLYLAGFLTNMRVIDTLNKNMINTEIYCRQDIYDLIELQRESDKRFRERFIRDNPALAKKNKESTFTLANRSQRAYGKMIVRLKEDNGSMSTFVGRA